MMLYTLNVDINMNIKINIQSISDIITNSSSEVFCTITGKDIESILDILSPLFGGDSDIEPTLSYYEDEDLEEGEVPHICIWMPYGIDRSSMFYKAGLEAILNQTIGKENYTIEYEY